MQNICWVSRRCTLQLPEALLSRELPRTPLWKRGKKWKSNVTNDYGSLSSIAFPLVSKEGARGSSLLQSMRFVSFLDQPGTEGAQRLALTPNFSLFTSYYSTVNLEPVTLNS